MIGFFTDPYPDELLYSACARYTDETNYPNKQAVVTELFGRRGFAAVYDFPTRLKHFVSVLPEGHNYSVDKLIDKNTLFPFYQPFLPKNRAYIVRNEMVNEANNRIHTRLGIRIKQVEALTHLRYCSKCVVEDREAYGETYWHRIHQLPGIPVCLQHKCFLENSKVKLGRMSSRYYQSAENCISVNKSKTRKLDLKNENHRILYRLASEAKWLLSHGNLEINNESLRERYFNSFLRNGYCYYNGRIRQKKLLKAINSSFSPDLYNFIGLISGKKNWLISLLQIGNVNKVYSPIRHLLLMSFIGKSAKEFITNYSMFQPFGNPPYPCLNIASNHYKEMRILECDILNNVTKDKNKQGLPLGIFRCDCGYVYQRIGPDDSEEDKFKFSLVREYGKVWETKFAEYWKDLSLSSTEIGKLIGISQTSVGRQAIRLKLPMNTKTTRSLQGYRRHRNPNKSFSDMKESYRNNWLKVIKRHPNYNRKQLLDRYNFLYLWLKRNDKVWVEQHLPDRETARRSAKLLNWGRIDKNLAKKIERICNEILESRKFPVRVSISEIIKRTGHKSWIEKRHKRLPLTTKIVDEKTETFEDFMLRKISWAKGYFIKKRKIPTLNQFKIKAVVRNKTSAESLKIQKAIRDAIDEIKRSMKC